MIRKWDRAIARYSELLVRVAAIQRASGNRCGRRCAWCITSRSVGRDDPQAGHRKITGGATLRFTVALRQSTGLRALINLFAFQQMFRICVLWTGRSEVNIIPDLVQYNPIDAGNFHASILNRSAEDAYIFEDSGFCAPGNRRTDIPYTVSKGISPDRTWLK